MFCHLQPPVISRRANSRRLFNFSPNREYSLDGEFFPPRSFSNPKVSGETIVVHASANPLHGWTCATVVRDLLNEICQNSTVILE
jgi:hypothetical protein